MNKASVQIWVGMALLVVAALATRLHGLGSHFSHIDDHLVVTHIQDVYRRPARPDEGTMAHYFNRYFDAARSVPENSTYAPFGSFLSAITLSAWQPYEEALWWGRLPSALAGVLVVVVVAWLGLQLFGRVGAATAGLLMLLSWENIIYSQQMEPYVWGQVAVLGLLAAALWYRRLTAPGLWHTVLWVLAYVVAFHMTYQAAALGPAYVVVSLWPHRYRLRMHRGQQLGMLLGGLLAVWQLWPLLYRLLATDLGSQGINWNAGPDGEFLFSWQQVVVQPAYLLSFWIKNTWHLFASLLGSSPLDSWTNWVQTALLLGLTTLGMALGWRKRTGWALFILLAMVGWTLMVLAGKFTYSPTRHSMLLTPLWALAAAAAVHGLWRYRPAQWVLTAAGAFFLVSFGANYAPERAARADAVSSGLMVQVVQRYRPDVIYGYSFSQQHTLIPELYADYALPQVRFGRAYTLVKKQSKDKTGTLLFFSHRKTLTEATLRDALLKEASPPADPILSHYTVLYEYQKFSTKEVEYSPQTHNGTNGCYIAVLKHKTNK